MTDMQVTRGALIDALEDAAFKMISDAFGMHMAIRVNDAGWQWPDDGPRFADAAIYKAVRILALVKAEKPA